MREEAPHQGSLTHNVEDGEGSRYVEDNAWKTSCYVVTRLNALTISVVNLRKSLVHERLST
jgi:hypothetical protein